MKTLSNTSIAAIFAVGLALLVWVMSLIPFFEDKETQTTNEMMLLRYHLHEKHAPIAAGREQPLLADSHLVVAAIDQKSINDLGRWPFSRSIHGDFLLLVAQEQPRAIGWDIFFTEQEPVVPATAPAVASPPAPTDSTTAPSTSTPAPAASNPAPTSTNAAPSDSTSEPAATSPAPAASASAPTAPETEPAPNAPSPPPADTNAKVPSAPPAPAASTNASAAFDLNSFPIGADLSATATNTAPSPAPASSTAAAPTHDVTSASVAPPTPPSSPTQPPSSPSPAAAIPAPPASSTPAPNASSSAVPDASSSDAGAPLNPDDQHFVDAAGQFPNMVTAAEQSQDPQTPAELSDANIQPTRFFTHVTGDITKVFTTPYAILPFPALRKATYFGFVNESGASGGGVRTTDPMVVNVGGKILPSFDLQVVMQYWGVNPDDVIIDLGHEITFPRPDGTKVHIPIDETGQITINYRARLENFRVKGYSQYYVGLFGKAQGQKSVALDGLPPIKDNILVVGVTFSGTDAGVTPLEDHGSAPLMVTHLNAINNILQQDFVTQVPGWIWMPIYALFLFGTGALMLRVGIAPMIPMGILALALWATVGFAILYFGNYLMPVAVPELGVLLLAGAVPTKRFFGEEREKLRVKKMMGAYLSDKIMAKLLANPDGAKLGGVKQMITIMFCDIRGFTAYCDNRDPQEVLNVVNDYFEEMTQVVFKYEGTVDKYIGDCIMAFWNAPEDQPDHAQRAVCCAMEMRYALANFKVKRAGLDTELFECGIGIHTGEALVGNMGSTLKVNYTAMGSTVNLGARLEALTKKLNERILISHDTFMQLTGDFPITDRGEAIVSGFANPIHVYGVGAEQDLGSAIKVGLKLAKKQDYTAEEVTKPIWAPAPLPEDADPNP